MREGSKTAKEVSKRRQIHMKNGQLSEKSAELLEYVGDVVYGSPSSAAVDVAGASRNGWQCWKDAQGGLAEDYRPKPQPT